MARFTQAFWADKAMRATPEDRRRLMQDLSRGVHEVTDDGGQPINFTDPGPTTCATAPRVEISKDQFGRTKMKSVNPVKAQVEARGEVDMNRFRAQMRLAETFKGEDKAKAVRAIYLEHLGVEI